MSLLHRLRSAAAAACLLLLCIGQAGATAWTPAQLAGEYARQVDRRLDVPPAEVQRYALLAERAFEAAGIQPAEAQYIVIVDRDPQVQALLLVWRSVTGSYQMVGASPVSTGRPGSFDHFETPLGVFEHSLANPDFRAEGTLNENGIRGYGAKDMRVFDFGWQHVAKGWGDRQVIEMRLQMHATDPDQLERRLGTVQSKGCIRIPATLDQLLDVHAILDADYERARADGDKLWMLREDRTPVPEPGRYLVVVDTRRQERPDWSPLPQPPRKRTPLRK